MIKCPSDNVVGYLRLLIPYQMYISDIQRQHLRFLTTIMNEYAQPKIVFISKPNSSLKAY